MSRLRRAALTPQTVQLQRAGCVLHCDVWGAGPPVLLVHGYLLSAKLWAPVAQRLAGDGVQLLVPDLCGHGRSDARSAMDIGDYADDAAALLDELGVRTPIPWIGLSMGGIVGLEFFRRHRARLRALGLMGARANAEDAEGRARWEALCRLVQREGPRAAVDAFIERVFAPGVLPELRAEFYDDVLRMSAHGVISAGMALARRADYTPTLAGIDCPALVAVGAEDRATPVETMRAIRKHVPRSTFEVIADAGHLPPIEQPEATADVLRRFLRSLPEN